MTHDHESYMFMFHAMQSVDSEFSHDSHLRVIVVL